MHGRLEAVDSNGLLPLRAADHAYIRAFDFRRYLQKVLPAHLQGAPNADPLNTTGISKFPSTSITRNACFAVARCVPSPFWEDRSLDLLPINHSVKPVEMRGGHSAAIARVKAFLKSKFVRYSEEHNEPELCATSNMSPYLHFGQISAHEIFSELVRREKWQPRKLALRSKGAREGWWNMSGSAENFWTS